MFGSGRGGPAESRRGQFLPLSACSLAAGAGTTRTATPAAAEPWLARAQREIAGMPVDTPKEFGALDPAGLAFRVYHLAPNAARRALVARLICRGLKSEVDTAARRAGAWLIIMRVRLPWRYRPEAARRFLQAADKPNGAAPTTDPLVPLFASWTESYRAETYLRSRLRRCLELPGRIRAGGNSARNLKTTDSMTPAARATQWALKQVAAASTRSARMIRPSFANSPSRFEAIRCRIDAGDLLRGRCRGGDRRQPPARQHSGRGGGDLCHAQVIVARGCLDAGDMIGFRLARMPSSWSPRSTRALNTMIFPSLTLRPGEGPHGRLLHARLPDAPN